MTKSDFIYGLTACGCLYTDGKTYYEHDELVKCFEDLGLIKEDKEQNNSDIYTFHCASKDVICKTIGAIPIDKIKGDIEQSRYGLVNDGLDLALKIIDRYTKGE